MNPRGPITCLCAVFAAAMMLGCASPPRAASESATAEIPRVTALYEKATQVHVHRFRKPLRDAQARAMRNLADECDKLLADTDSWDRSAQLTAAGEAERNAARADIHALRSSLEGMRSAAEKRDVRSLDTAYAGAAAAYARIREKLDTPRP